MPISVTAETDGTLTRKAIVLPTPSRAHTEARLQYRRVLVLSTNVLLALGRDSKVHCGQTTDKLTLFVSIYPRHHPSVEPWVR